MERPALVAGRFVSVPEGVRIFVRKFGGSAPARAGLPRDIFETKKRAMVHVAFVSISVG
jgi:hypothetical protein